MSKVATYLQEHLRGEVITAAPVRAAYAHDKSVLTALPDMVVYPFNLSDIRKLARFTWQLAEKGHVMPLIARGGGTDTTGAAIGKGAIVDMTVHMNNILEIDTKQRLARVQPGVLCKTLQDTLMTHGYFIPAFSGADAKATVGGAIANNFAGDMGIKYGAIRQWVEQVEVVLANGEVAQTGRINRRELDKKKGLSTLEGELYRQVDGAVTDNPEVVNNVASVSSNAGYALDAVKAKDGAFDLTPMIAGSQGTLGIISEVILRLAPYTPSAETVVIGVSSISEAHDSLDALRKLEPVKIEMLDASAIEMAKKQQTSRFAELFGEEAHLAALFFVEFDDKHASKKAKKLEKSFSKSGFAVVRTNDFDQRAVVWQLYNNAIAAVTFNEKEGRIGLPVMDDAWVPNDKFEAYLELVAALSAKYRASWPVWGHAGDGRFAILPMFDLRKVTDRQKALKLMDDYYAGVIELGGIVAAGTAEGRLHVPCAAKQFSAEALEAFAEVKRAFDPFGTLNPGVKQSQDLKSLLPQLRPEYSPI